MWETPGHRGILKIPGLHAPHNMPSFSQAIVSLLLNRHWIIWIYAQVLGHFPKETKLSIYIYDVVQWSFHLLLSL